ncbi:hypothetical protein [Vibrio phage RYC]|nr:hypothetical protein [Vibrio phage RYC]
MFSLKYHRSTDKLPDHKSLIQFYVLKEGMGNVYKQLTVQTSKVSYGWFSRCGEVHEYYNPEEESHYNIGDVRKATWFDPNTSRESHEHVKLFIELDEQPLWGWEKEDVPIIAWQYEHVIERHLAYHMGVNYFPTNDINNLLREEVIKVLHFEKREVGEIGNRYYQIYADVEYHGWNYHIRMAQHGFWKDSDWELDNENNIITIGKVTVYQWQKLERGNRRYL